MIRFKQLFYEGVMELPLSSYKDIAEYVKEMFVKAKTKKTKRITPKAFQPKEFNLDLSNTKYGDLHDKWGEVKITVKFENGGELGAFNRGTPISKNSYITLNISNDDKWGITIESILNTLEHELLHYIQDLKNIKGRGRYGYHRKKNDKYDYEGLLKKSISGRRVKHHLRPVEYQTNLNSLLRKLQYGYKGEDDKEQKKEYIKRFINKELAGIKDKVIRRGYIKLLYDMFINEKNINSEEELKKYFDYTIEEPKPKTKRSKKGVISNPLFDIPIAEDNETLGDLIPTEKIILKDDIGHYYLKQILRDTLSEDEIDLLPRNLFDSIADVNWNKFIPYIQGVDAYYTDDQYIKLTVGKLQMVKLFSFIKDNYNEKISKILIKWWLERVFERLGYEKVGKLRDDVITEIYDKI
jgi:hypothetical protein